jgi:hypothetical protein
LANSHPLQIAADVAALLPSEAVTRFRDDPAYEELQCTCGRPIEPGEPAALVVLRDVERDLHHLSATHPACQPSAVIDTDLSHIAEPGDGHNVTITASLILPKSSGRRARRQARPLPALAVGTRSGFAGVNPESGDLADLVLDAALRTGLHLVTDPRRELDPPTQDGWLVTLDPLGGGEYGLHIASPAGALAREASAYAPWSQWEKAVRHTRGVNLYVGAFLVEPYDRPTLLDELAAAGRLAGARVRAVFGPVPAE